MHVDVLNRDVPVVEVLLVHDAAVEWNQVLNARDHRFVQSRLHSSNGVLTVPSPNQQLRQQRIEAPRHFVAGVGVRVAADAKTAGKVTLPQTTRAGNEFTGVLRIQPALDGVPSPGDVLLFHGQGFTLRHPYAEFHEVVTGDEFGDRVLDLNARVDLEEVKIAVGIAQELKRCLLYTSPSPRDRTRSRMPSSA